MALPNCNNDVIYAYDEELENRAGTYTVVQRYPETGTVLVKVDRELINKN